MDVGDVFTWDQYPYSNEETKRRWFIYLGEYKDTPDPFDNTSSIMIIAPTTTTQTQYYEPGEMRAGIPFVRFSPNEGFGFTEECILDLAHRGLVIPQDIFLENLESQKIQIKGKISDQKLREIYDKIYHSRGYPLMLKRRIHENLNKTGISNLPKPKREKR